MGKFTYGIIALKQQQSRILNRNVPLEKILENVFTIIDGKPFVQIETAEESLQQLQDAIKFLEEHNFG